MDKEHFGMIGLGTMGRNFLLNIAEQGIRGVGYDLDATKRDLLLKEGAGMPLAAAGSLVDLMEKLESPRNIMLLVPAGPVVDKVIADLLPYLEADDLIIDGGNSHFSDTDRREADVSSKGFGFMGMGVSGGEEGARHGASIMPGGRREHYERIEHTLQAVSAKVNGEPCVAYMGTGSAGHFVKMVHNGIEYGLMQILAETYDFMRRVLKMDYAQMSEVFANWNRTELNSFLVEITSDVLKKVDAESGRPLLELILDKAAQKGTGKWTSQAAMDHGVPIPTIDSAVSMRQISAQKETRVLIAERFGTNSQNNPAPPAADGEVVTSEEQHDLKAVLARDAVTTDVSELQKQNPSSAGDSESTWSSSSGERQSKAVADSFMDDLDASLIRLRNTLLSSFIVTYAQGLSLLQTASEEREYDLDLAEIARIWRGGCIIRSSMLEDMRSAFEADPALPNLILDERFARRLDDNRADWHSIVADFSRSRVPSMCMSSSLAYFEAFRSAHLPANLIQAQRDYFGAHTYQRTDREGVFHTPDWEPIKP